MLPGLVALTALQWLVVCAVDCAAGDTYTLDYSATLSEGYPSGLGGIAYQFLLVCTVSEVPVPAAVSLLGLGLLVLSALACAGVDRPY